MRLKTFEKVPTTTTYYLSNPHIVNKVDLLTSEVTTETTVGIQNFLFFKVNKLKKIYGSVGYCISLRYD